jgi:hypothetical protein
MTSSARLQKEADAARVGLSSALEDLRQSVTTTAITNGAMTFAKEGSTAVARAAVDRAMASPVAAMMIGAGLLMLMIGDKKVGSAVGSLVDQGKSAVKSAADAATDKVGSLAHMASDKAGSLAQRVTGSAEDATTQAQDALAEGKQYASDMLAQGQQQAQDLLAKGQQQSQQALNQAQQMFEQGRSRLEQFAQEQPILVAALGVAFGAALGATLPLSKAEQQFLAEPAKKAASMGGELAQKVADTVTDQLGGQNIDHKIGEVVEAVSSTVTQSLSRG